MTRQFQHGRTIFKDSSRLAGLTVFPDLLLRDKRYRLTLISFPFFFPCRYDKDVIQEHDNCNAAGTPDTPASNNRWVCSDCGSGDFVFVMTCE